MIPLRLTASAPQGWADVRSGEMQLDFEATFQVHLQLSIVAGALWALCNR